MSRLAVIAGLVAGAVGQQTYVWSGRSTILTDSANWNGASPLDPANPVQSTSFGTAGQPLVAAVTDGTTLDLGGTVRFNTDTTLLLGSGVVGAGSTLLIPDATGRSGVAVFDPVSLNPAGPTYANLGSQPAYDLTCNMNWRMGTSTGAIPVQAPCSTTTLMIPTNNGSYTVSSFGASLTVNSIQGSPMGGVTPTLTSCGGGSGYSQMLGSNSLVLLPNCPTTVTFAMGTGQTSSCSTGLSSSCGPSVTFRAELNASSGGATYTMILRGPYAGIALQMSGNMIMDVTTATNVTMQSGLYVLGNVTIDPTTGAVAVNPAYPVLSSSSASSASAVPGGSVGLIAIIAVIVIVVVVVIVVVLKKKGSGDNEPKMPTKSTIAFDNPLYDDAASPGFAEATYDESGNDAYLDVPIASDQDFAETGYMDVHGGGEASGGYMDVDANDDDDQF
eukprot:m.442909 g.442909  ORF g.442909 m.442909 type:complete len:445 (+) comp18876_c0_seq1:2092-3426(+)